MIHRRALIAAGAALAAVPHAKAASRADLVVD